MTSKSEEQKDAQRVTAWAQMYPTTEARAGHVVAVPLSDGTYVLAHVALHEVSSIAVFFDHRKGSPDELFDGIDAALKSRPIAVLSLVTNGPWPIIALEDPMYPASMLATRHTYQAAEVCAFLEVYYGLRAWEETGIADPYDSMLFAEVPESSVAEKAPTERGSSPRKKAGKEAGRVTAAPVLLKRKRVRVQTGQLAAVPLSDGSYVLVHVALYYGSIFTAHFDHRRGAPEQLMEGMEAALQDKLIAILAVTSDEIQDGHWPILGHKIPRYPAKMLDMKRTSYTASATRCLFEAYYGLRPWDELHDPKGYEKLLLPGVPVPPTVRYKRDFEKDAAAAASAPQANAEPPVTDGPAEIHIEIKYPGDALPSIELLHRRQALERSLEEAGAGEVTDAGGGGGVMDVYLQTSDVRRAMPLVEAAIKSAGFEKDATIETTALSDAEDDE